MIMGNRCLMTTAVLVGGLIFFGQSVAVAQMYVYPNEGQSAEQEEQDKFVCHQWAVQQTGVSPDQPAQVYNAPQQPRGVGALGGAAIGSAAGAIGGAIAGHPGEGAAIGAAVGGFFGVVKRRLGIDQQYQQQQQEIQAHNAAVEQYDRAFATCLSGKGYTVS